jgi:hypothetical protein
MKMIKGDGKDKRRQAGERIRGWKKGEWKKEGGGRKLVCKNAFSFPEAWQLKKFLLWARDAEILLTRRARINGIILHNLYIVRHSLQSTVQFTVQSTVQSTLDDDDVTSEVQCSLSIRYYHIIQFLVCTVIN